MNNDNANTRHENEREKSSLSGEELIATDQPTPKDELPFQELRKPSQPKSYFKKIVTGLNVLFTALMVFVTCLLVYWASKQWDVMNRQWEAMKKSNELTIEMNKETKGLSEETIKYTKEQTEASKKSVEASKISADAAKITAKIAEKSLDLERSRSEAQLALDLQEKRPFLAPVILSKKVAGSERYRWSWGARNTGTMVARLVFSDLLDRRHPNEPWRGAGEKRDEIIYPGETLELMGETGELSGHALICIVFEEVRESGTNRRWTGFALYFFTEPLERLTQSSLEPEMQLVHRIEKTATPSEVATCDARAWFNQVTTVSTSKSNNTSR